MSFPRLAGILLHPISLPSRGGIGDLGPAAYEFVNFLAAGKQGLWQVLPLGPPANGTSPYSSTSAFAGNPLLISLERLADRGWIDKARLQELSQDVSGIDYGEVSRHKLPLLAEAAGNFLARNHGNGSVRFDKFCQDNDWWLEDFVLFDALRDRYNGQSWKHWPRDLARRTPAALEHARSELDFDLSLGRVIQFFFYEQWHALRVYCAQRSIRVVGDIAIFVDYDSADVWANRDMFRLKDDLEPEVVSGVPPDAFSATGQRWGNPLYNWQTMKASGYSWWTRRLRWATQNCDYIRLDHFRGFAQFWEIPANDPTAVNGRWVNGPADDLFITLKQSFGGLPFFAEDLGVITPDVTALRERHKIPGMAVLQFGFGDPGAHIYLPHRLTPDCVIYTGTHDNDTALGWFDKQSEPVKDFFRRYLRVPGDAAPWDMIRAGYGSPSRLFVMPLQDLLSLGSDARMNTPGQAAGNWQWRFTRDQLDRLWAESAEYLKELAKLYER